MIRVTIVLVLLLSIAATGDDFDWHKPSEDLIEQTVCPIDSTADAMVEDKEAYYEIVHDPYRQPYLTIISKKRIKIYTENGLEYANHKEYYNSYTDIKRIKAYCYNPDGTITKIDKGDIHDEQIIKDRKRNLKVKAKSFALAGAVPGSVIDIFIETRSEDLFLLPVFRYQEEIPVLRATCKFKLPHFFAYTYHVNNQDLLKLQYKEEEIPTIGRARGDLLFSCSAENIPAIEKEYFKPPERNLSTDLFITLSRYYDGYNELEFASSWEVLLGHFEDAFNNAVKKSKKAKEYAESIKNISDNNNVLLKTAFNHVRDSWSNQGNYGVSQPSDKVDKMMEQESMDAIDKATVLCAILKYLGIESEVVWVCTDNADFEPINYPTLYIFDHTLVYIPSKSLFLDPADPGSEVGLLDCSLSGRLIARPMSPHDDPIIFTPEFDKLCGRIANISMDLNDELLASGSGNITYFNQAAIDIRRDHKTVSEQDLKAIVEHQLFDKENISIKEVIVISDATIPADQFKIEFQLEPKAFMPDDGSMLDLQKYPGPGFARTIADPKPPRIYPFYFPEKVTDVYTIEWHLPEKLLPLDTTSVNFKESNGFMNYSLVSKFNSETNTLSVRRQYTLTEEFLQETTVQAIEEFWQNSSRYDLAFFPMELAE